MPPKQSIQQRFLRNVFAEASARVFYLGTRFFIPPFVLARVGMEAYGLYGTVFILVAYFGMSAVGFSNAYVKYVAEFSESGDTARANRLLSSGVTIMSVVGVVGMAAFVSAWPAVSRWMKVPSHLSSEARFLTFLIVGVFFIYLALSVFRDTLTGLQEISLVQKVWSVSVILETLLIFALVGKGFGLRGLGVAFAFRTAFEVTSHWMLTRRRATWLKVRFTKPDKESLRLLLRFGGVVQLNCMLSIFLNSIERVIATPLLGLESSGLLDLGKRFPSMATSIPSAFASSMLPSAAKVHALPLSREEADRQLRTLYLSSARLMNTISGILFAFLTFAAAPCIVFWLGKASLSQASLLTTLFAIGTQVHLLTGPGTSTLKASGRPKMEFHYSLTNFLALATLIPMSYLFAMRWSVLGIAAAVVSSTIVSASWFLWHAHRTLGISPGEYLKTIILPGVTPYVAATLTIWPVAHWMPFGSRLQAASVLAWGGLLYLIAASAGLALIASPKELSFVMKSARKVRAIASLRRRVAVPLETTV